MWCIWYVWCGVCVVLCVCLGYGVRVYVCVYMCLQYGACVLCAFVAFFQGSFSAWPRLPLKCPSSHLSPRVLRFQICAPSPASLPCEHLLFIERVKEKNISKQNQNKTPLLASVRSAIITVQGEEGTWREDCHLKLAFGHTDSR